MDWLKVLVQRRLIASVLFSICGYLGIHASQDTAQAMIATLLGFGPAVMNLVSYFRKSSITWRPELIAGLLPAIATATATLLQGLGVPIPDELMTPLLASLTSGGALIAQTLSVTSSFSTNAVQPTGSLASPNP